MGLGDWIMASADAALAYKHHGKRVVFGDGKRKFWSPVFENNKKIAQDNNPEEIVCWIANYPGKRPYIKSFDKKRVLYNEDFRAVPGELYLTDEERSFVKHRDYVLVEPNVKDWTIGINKSWNFGYWQELVKMDLPWVQMGAGWMLRGVDYVYTPTFRHALAMVEQAALVVTTDGALHHAAAAMGVPAVVIWGGLVNPSILGYHQHVNLCAAKSFCGNLEQCDHCREAMDKITPGTVKKVLKQIL